LNGGSLRSWAVPSLMVGAVATLVDVGVLLAAIRWLHASTAGGAMLGVAVGSTVAFLGNRSFAFRSSATAWLPEALRFLAGTTAGMLVHAALVRTLADRVGVPVVLAKLVSDLCVFTFGQLLLLRFFVFPARRGWEAVGRARAPRWDVREGLDAPIVG
jgi:putative flippase GtrA